MTHRRTAAWMAALTGATLALSACTPLATETDAEASATPTATAVPEISVPAAAPEGTPDPCAAISLERLDEIVKAEMSEGQFNAALSSDGRNICAWRPANEERSVPRVQVEINWEFPDPVRHRELATEVFGKTFDVKREIPGAEEAYATPSRQTIGMGIEDTFVKVSLIHPGRKKGQQITFQLAKEVAATLNPQAEPSPEPSQEG